MSHAVQPSESLGQASDTKLLDFGLATLKQPADVRVPTVRMQPELRG